MLVQGGLQLNKKIFSGPHDMSKHQCYGITIVLPNMIMSVLLFQIYSTNIFIATYLQGLCMYIVEVELLMLIMLLFIWIYFSP